MGVFLISLYQGKNPYEADPEKIPATDLYADVAFYGRYHPQPDDFPAENRIYPADEGGRDVFALGSVIIKSTHLHEHEHPGSREIDFSYADANEASAILQAKAILTDIKVPATWFYGKVFIIGFSTM
ncbi:kinase-like domain-containing protein [Penicillium angulare]|uniref:kinase-like domain-containing protein n=1 Tax=Penicillium angulare TaxID=116970 RepID=UPI0025417CA7|nr:kinase-like domain-containing protein [Penicillium angulare]KAJ5272483.1 kinase-like domain-containing protein [Penicillium angulare]